MKWQRPCVKPPAQVLPASQVSHCMSCFPSQAAPHAALMPQAALQYPSCPDLSLRAVFNLDIFCAQILVDIRTLLLLLVCPVNRNLCCVLLNILLLQQGLCGCYILLAKRNSSRNIILSGSKLFKLCLSLINSLFKLLNLTISRKQIG